MDNLKQIVEKAKNIVFLGGAGVSTGSGIPDFRSAKGIYNQDIEYPPEVILSHDFFIEKTEAFYDFYKQNMIYLNAKPNETHTKIAKLENEGKIKAVITQNIDGLHQKAGSQVVLELHGSVYRNYCMDCKKFYGVDDILSSKGVPICECEGIIKPDVVLYQESLDDYVIRQAIHAIQQADVLIVGGTSLAVYPAAGLVDYFSGNHLVLINQSPTSYDHMADVCIAEDISKVFESL